jgi:hypothetical protein
MCLPLDFALSLPSDVRSTIISLSNCAKEPKTLNNKDCRGFAVSLTLIEETRQKSGLCSRKQRLFNGE